MAEPSSEAEVEALFDHLVNRAERERLPAARLGEVAAAVRLPDAGSRSRSGGAGSCATAATPWCSRYGPWLLANAFQAADEIEQATGASIRVVNLPWLNRVDSAWLRQAIGARRSIVTLDNHYVHGGQGEMLAAAIAALGLEPAARVTRIGVTELPECGTNDEVLAHHGLDVAGLVKSLRQAVPQSHKPMYDASHRNEPQDMLGAGDPENADPIIHPHPAAGTSLVTLWSVMPSAWRAVGLPYVRLEPGAWSPELDAGDRADGPLLGHRRHAAHHRQGGRAGVGGGRQGGHRPGLPAVVHPRARG